ncbi:O-antigen/teichoic acid export membrane protein [Bacillus sp. SLBN-46]|nr:O-antigen/teichoic acid export membrane protein [Bacillus sp. SLBN-46]
MIVLFVQTVYLNIKVTRLYPFLKTKSTEKLPKEEYNLILKNVKAMVFHKLGDFSINGTDNLIISAFLSVSVVGLYSNYAMIISSINAFIVLFFESITASMGNLIATSSDRKKLEVFNITNFISFWIYGFATICFYNLLNPTIEIWLGNKYLIAQEIILVVLFNYYLTGMRVPVTTVKSAAGIYDVDKFTPLTQAVINLVVSILLVQKFGLIGVFIGTLISSLVLPCWQRPYILYKYVFKTSSRPYFLEYIKYLSVIFGIILVTSWIINTFFLETTIMNYIARIIVCLLVPNLIIIICFYRSSVFREVIQILKSVLKGKSRWIKKSV